MALLTRLDERTARRLLEAFGLVLERIEPLPERGTVNSCSAVTASGRRWFLRVNEGKGEAHVRAEARVVAHLAARGVPVPAPLPTVAGEPFARLDTAEGAKTVSLLPWVEGREARPVADAAVAGEALGLVHRAAAGLGELPDDLYALPLLEARLEAARAAGRPELVEILALVGEELARARARVGVGAVPRGLVHQDLFPDNLLLDERGRLAAVLDFEQSTAGRLVYDLAVTLLACAWDEPAGRMDAGAARALVAAYEAARPLEDVERATLADELRLGAARFTLTRIGDIALRPGVDPDLARRKDWRLFAARLAWARGLRPGEGIP